MQQHSYPAIDMKATGRNIRSLREERGLSVEDLQDYFDFNEPRSIYKWQAGKCLPSIDNLYALSALLDVPMDSIIVGAGRRDHEPQDETCGVFLRAGLCFCCTA
ncbi:MAG: helix-turn-helix transcriptional regulator [Clostridia bacterium]|nr:helix-turn-helix transcriptional regulator [Clostridia bacterium]